MVEDARVLRDGFVPREVEHRDPEVNHLASVLMRIKDRRTTEDWVQFIQHLVDQHYPDADCIRVVLDNLSTHKPVAFYEFFEPAEARRLVDKLEFHFTPVHGSRLNMAEIEFNALEQQYLDRRIPDAATLHQEVAAWKNQRNSGETIID